jgi:hypothetical protein
MSAVFGLLGAMLLLDLVLPLAGLLSQADWSAWMGALRRPEALGALASR